MDELGKEFPRNKPRYHFYRWEHKHEDRLHDSVLFIYSIPSGGCTIKERMLSSSCKGPFLETVSPTSYFGLRLRFECMTLFGDRFS